MIHEEWQSRNIQTHHAVVEPLWDEVVQEFGVNQLSVVQVQRPKREHHKLGNKTDSLFHLKESVVLWDKVRHLPDFE